MSIQSKVQQMTRLIESERGPAPRPQEVPPLVRPGTGGSPSMYFGKPAAAWSSGATITLDPCDILGSDNGLANVTAYLLPSQASDSIETATIAGGSQAVTCELGTDVIVAYQRDGDGDAYVVGTKKQILTEFRYYASSPTFELQCKVRFDWGLFCSSESGWETVTSDMSQCAT